MITIPLVDLAAQHAAVAEEVTAGWQEVFARTAFPICGFAFNARRTLYSGPASVS